MSEFIRFIYQSFKHNKQRVNRSFATKNLFVCFHSTPTQLRSYGAQTRKMILAKFECYKLKATQ
jgi:hypothetical protein